MSDDLPEYEAKGTNFTQVLGHLVSQFLLHNPGIDDITSELVLVNGAKVTLKVKRAKGKKKR